MTKEELKQEAEEYAEGMAKYYASTHEDCIPSQFEKYLRNAYISSAEPREKRIADLEKRCANYEMNISKMEKGTCDICKEIEKDKRITELEMTVGTLRTFSNEQATCIEELEKACEETQELLDKQIESTYKLDKENAELKEINSETLAQLNLDNGELITELTKAKTYLKYFIEILKKLGANKEPLVIEAEQFLKDSEVEK